MGTRRGVACELHAYSTDSEFTDLLKGRYITDIVDDEILVLDNGMWLHIQTENEDCKGGTFIQYLNVCGRNDARIMSARLVDDYEENSRRPLRSRPVTSSRPSRVRKHPRLSPVFLAAKASSMLSLTLSSEREALIRLCVLPAPRLGFFIS